MLLVKMLPLSILSLVSLVIIPLAQGTECTTSSDCPPASPYCSKWGYCQWSSRYGDSGPGDGDCRRDEDCRSPRVCRAGHCRVTQS